MVRCQINSQLSVGNAHAARNLPSDHPFDYVLSVGYYDGHGYSCPEASDSGDEYVFPDSPEHEYDDFIAAVEHVIDRLSRNERVLIHCQAGGSRSPAVCAAVLAEYYGHSLDDALDVIYDAYPSRDHVRIDPALRESLERYCDDSISHDLHVSYQKRQA